MSSQCAGSFTVCVVMQGATTPGADHVAEAGDQETGKGQVRCGCMHGALSTGLADGMKQIY